MANEILRRNPTSTGNRRVFTWAGWVKINKLSTTANCIWYVASAGNSEFNISLVSSTGSLNVYDYAPSAYQYQYATSRLLRDFSNWFHLVVAVDTTQVREDDRFKIYINGCLYNGSYSIETTAGGINHQTRMNTPGEINYIGQNIAGGSTYSANCQLTDLFMVDGQALTPDVFGFNKQGKGYISVGSTQSTDFRPGQWVPKTPRIIKAEIDRRGGFGVNGFYLPMNDSNNFGADFHCTPNSIIKLQENLPQPKCRIDGVGDYTGALRDDPFKQYLVLALPFVSGGLQNGFGDYSAAIKGSGSNKTITVNGSLATSNTVSLYYGSSAFLNNGGTSGTQFLNTSHSDYALGLQNFTIECWIFPTSLYNYWTLLSTRPSDGGFGDAYHIGTDSAGSIGFYSNAYDAKSSNGVINVNQWSHIAAVRTGSTLTLYLNGVAVAVNTNYTKNLTRSDLTIGRLQNLGTNLESATGYIQDLRIYKGVAKYTGGFDVPRPYTPVGIATWRAVPDTTANNFCTWNPLSAFDGAQTNGNLTSTTNDLMGTVGISTGKWYWEIYDTTAVGGGGNVMHHGVSFTNFNQSVNGRFDAAPDGKLVIRLDAVNQSVSGTSITITSQTGTVPTYSNGDIYAIALDLDNGQVRHYRNGSVILTTNFTYNRNTQAIPYTRNNGLSCSANFGQNPTFSGNTTAGTFTDSNGKGLFKYQPPSGFLALCEDNLPTPAISDPGEHFKTVLYTGDNNSGRSIVGVGFTPDLVWVKHRNTAGGHGWFDSVRGPGLRLDSQSTGAETSATGVMSFDSDGFSLGSVFNTTNINTVGWCWRAGAGTTSTNTNGSITSVVSVNQDAGFSIVSYTGNATSGSTVGHGLGKTPAFMILKSRGPTARSWGVYHKSIGNTGMVFLDLTNATNTASFHWNNTSPTSTTFTLGNGSVTNSAENIIAYCWTEIEGFSKFGSYVGNGSADGPFVYCGFKPAWVMIKRIDISGENWLILDSSRTSTNPTNAKLAANSTVVENDAAIGTDTQNTLDFLSNGFKARTLNTGTNASGGTYIFAAFAESPFQTANSK